MRLTSVSQALPLESSNAAATAEAAVAAGAAEAAGTGNTRGGKDANGGKGGESDGVDVATPATGESVGIAVASLGAETNGTGGGEAIEESGSGVAIRATPVGRGDGGGEGIEGGSMGIKTCDGDTAIGTAGSMRGVDETRLARKDVPLLASKSSNDAPRGMSAGGSGSGTPPFKLSSKHESRVVKLGSEHTSKLSENICIPKIANTSCKARTTPNTLAMAGSDSPRVSMISRIPLLRESNRSGRKARNALSDFNTASCGIKSERIEPMEMHKREKSSRFQGSRR